MKVHGKAGRPANPVGEPPSMLNTRYLVYVAVASPGEHIADIHPRGFAHAEPEGGCGGSPHGDAPRALKDASRNAREVTGASVPEIEGAPHGAEMRIMTATLLVGYGGGRRLPIHEEGTFETVRRRTCLLWPTRYPSEAPGNRSRGRRTETPSTIRFADRRGFAR